MLTTKDIKTTSFEILRQYKESSQIELKEDGNKLQLEVKVLLGANGGYRMYLQKLVNQQATNIAVEKGILYIQGEAIGFPKTLITNSQQMLSMLYNQHINPNFSIPPNIYKVQKLSNNTKIIDTSRIVQMTFVATFSNTDNIKESILKSMHELGRQLLSIERRLDMELTENLYALARKKLIKL